jgi:hypothetical protein
MLRVTGRLPVTRLGPIDSLLTCLLAFIILFLHQPDLVDPESPAPLARPEAALLRYTGWARALRDGACDIRSW